MALKDLGKKRKEFYDSPGIVKEKEKIIYPELDLPLEIAGDNDVDDEVTLTVKGRISGMQNTKYSKRITIEAKQGEIISNSKKEK